MRSKSALANTVTSLSLQFVVTICGMIVPRLFITTFGSTVNGTVYSITQFLNYIVLLESGIGGVIKASLYKPLAEKNIEKISGILSATQSFFKKITYIFILYMIFLACFYNKLVNSEFSWFYTFSLVLIIGISTVAQYYFGITYQIMLQADQKGFIGSSLQIGATILNALIVVLLINLNCSVHIVKLGSALVFVIRPIVINIYVHKKYKIIKDIKPDNTAIKQRWNGLGQHIAFFIHSNTDVAILSLLANMREVSVYLVHTMVISGIQKIITALSDGFTPAMGDMIAQGEKKILNKTIDMFEFINFYLVTILFTITAIMIEPFIMVYTRGVYDVNYIRPLFAYIMCLSEALYTIRIVYSGVTLSAGHYRQTAKGAYIEVILNITISLCLVKFIGLTGVAIGTCAAMIYRTFDYVFYLSKHIVKRSVKKYFKKILVNSSAVIMSVICTRFFINIEFTNWLQWILYALAVSCIVFVFVTAVNFVFYRTVFAECILKFKSILTSKLNK